MRVVILGGAGQVGAALQAILANHPEVTVFAPSRAELNITDNAALVGYIDSHEPDWLINCAAYTNVAAAEEDEVLADAVNHGAVAAMANICQRKQIKFIHLSTDYVFDGQKTGLYTESDTPNPLNSYGKSKLAGEQAITAIYPEAIIMRTSWVFAAQHSNFVATISRLLVTRTHLTVIADQYGAPTAASDIAAAIKTMLTMPGGKKPCGIYHFSGTPYVSWYEFALKIRSTLALLTETPLAVIHPIATKDYPDKVNRPHNSRLDCQQIKGQFAIEQPDWQSSLKNMLSQSLDTITHEISA